MNDRLISFSSLPQKIQAAINSRPEVIFSYSSRHPFTFWIGKLKASNLMTPEIKTELAAYCLSAANRNEK